MIAAIYARKSTEQNGVADEAKSVTRQIENARAYCARKGWEVADHIYVDDAVSGAAFGESRPGLARLLNALAPRSPFQVLVMSEESRMGRARQATEYALKQISDAGVEVWYYLEDRKAQLDDATGSFIEAVRLYASEMEREKARQRTFDAMRRKAGSGYSQGGTVYGYRTREVMNGDQRAHVVREIDPEQAAVVVRIFEMALSKGLRRIAQALTAEGVPPPRNDGKGWAPTAVREMLRRDLYRGVIVWGKTRRVDKGGRVGLKVARPEAEWQRAEAPELRIIQPALWAAVQERLEKTRVAYLRFTGGKLAGRPESGIESKYLLSGFASCAECGGGMVVTSRARATGGKVYRYLECGLHHQRGDKVCANALTVPMADADRAVLDALRQEVLDAEVIAQAIKLAAEAYTAKPKEITAQRKAAEAEVKKIDGELGRLVEALAGGGAMPTLKDAIRSREQRRADLTAQLEHLDGLAKAPGIDGAALKAELRKRLGEWRELLLAEPVKARQILRKLINGRLTMAPDAEAGAYTFTGTATLGRLLAGVAGNGQERWCRERGSNPHGPFGPKVFETFASASSAIPAREASASLTSRWRVAQVSANLDKFHRER